MKKRIKCWCGIRGSGDAKMWKSWEHKLELLAKRFMEKKEAYHVPWNLNQFQTHSFGSTHIFLLCWPELSQDTESQGLNPPRSLNLVAFLPFCLFNSRLRSEMNPQEVAWKSLRKQGAGLCHRMHAPESFWTWVMESKHGNRWFLLDTIHNGEC